MKTVQIIRIGMSLLPNTAPSLYEAQHREGLRVLGLLDGGLPAALVKEPSGRPRFADAHADFSISHSRRMVAVSFSGGRTGCDIQYVHPGKKHEAIAGRLFFPEELRYMDAASGEEERRLRFCRLWTLKECFLKANGFSVFAMKKAPVFLLQDAGAASSAGGEDIRCRPNAKDCPYPLLSYYLYECRGSESYVLAAAREGAGAVGGRPSIVWFSEESLPFTRYPG